MTGFQGCLLRWASGPWENPQRYVLSPQRNGSAPACSARRRSGKGPGTRAGQASLLCADGRTRDSAREHEEADYICRSSSRGRNSWFNDRDSTRPQHPLSNGIGRSRPSTRRPRQLHQTVGQCLTFARSGQDSKCDRVLLFVKSFCMCK
ncbi:hypothetical protein MTO96_026233 [Rhipicephalus appendiculatus]